MQKSGITRRKFLIGSAAGGASLMAAPYVGFDAWAAKEKTSSQDVKVTPTLCDACGNWCAINVFTQGGRYGRPKEIPLQETTRDESVQKVMRCCTRSTIRTGLSPH